MAVLALYNSGSSSKPSVLIQPNGNRNFLYYTIFHRMTTLNSGGATKNFEFQMDEDTQVYHSCSATLNGELFVFGGSSSTNNIKKQVSFYNDYRKFQKFKFRFPK